MEPLEIISKYYRNDSPGYKSLVQHSRLVADRALEIARNHPELEIDMQFLEEAAMLHDIGVFMCDAPDIECFGSEPYIRHGVIGAEILRKEGLPRHALVCERHTGSGLTLQQIEETGLPLPHREMLPISNEEKIICLADKFYSKSKPGKEKKIEKIRKSLSKYGEETVCRFDELCKTFL